MRPPVLRASFGLAVDSFAGAGGASIGLERALGRPVDIAINHDPIALAVHAANHPHTEHLCESVWDVDPVEACAGRPVDVAWFSPTCTHFSRAKGGPLRDQKIRSLAWVVTRWMKAVRPRVVFLENVSEFESWGPLVDGVPCKRRAGLTYRRWIAKMHSYGYAVEWRHLVAADYGAPTSRRRLFLIARCDGQPIVWPEPTHGPGLAPYRTAAECIDWSIPVPSIFDRARPLAEATLRRVARGIERFVLRAADPFIILLTHPRDARVHSVHEPMRTVTAANRGELAFVAPTLVQTGYGEREGQAPRSLDLHAPLGTVVAGGQKHAFVAAFLAKHFGGHETPGASLARPLSTVTARDHHALVTAAVTGSRAAEVRAFLTKFYGTSTGQALQLPLPTVTAGGEHLGIVTVRGERFEIADIGMRLLQPHELAAAQGFPSTYRLDRGAEGQAITKTAQVRLVGNSVCPDIAEAIVAANTRGEARRVA